MNIGAIDFLNQLNEYGQIDYDHYSYLHDLLTSEEPEWEYGACYQGDSGRELLWFSMGNGGFAIREAAEKEVDRYADAQIQLCRRRKAGPWEPVEN